MRLCDKEDWVSISHWGLFYVPRPKPNLFTQFIPYKKLEREPEWTLDQHS